MPFYIDSKKLIPVQTVEIGRDSERSDAGIKKRSFFSITVNGNLVVNMGSPTSSGTWWTSSGYPPDETIAEDSRLTSILAKQAALSQVLCQEGVWHELQPFDGSTPTKWIPRVAKVVFAPGNWVNYCPYTISMETDWILYGTTRIDCGSRKITTNKDISSAFDY